MTAYLVALLAIAGYLLATVITANLFQQVWGDPTGPLKPLISLCWPATLLPVVAIRLQVAGGNYERTVHLWDSRRDQLVSLTTRSSWSRVQEFVGADGRLADLFHPASAQPFTGSQPPQPTPADRRTEIEWLEQLFQL